VKRLVQPMLHEESPGFHVSRGLFPVFAETIPEKLENARVTNHEIS